MRSHRLTRLLVGGEALALVFFTLIVPIEVVYAKETLGTDEAGYGVLLSVVGRRRSCSAAWSSSPSGAASALALILLSTLAIGVAYLGMAASRELWLACAFSVLGGAGQRRAVGEVMTALQEATPDDLQARVTGAAGVRRRRR